MAASACVMEDEKILSEFYMNTKQTHSQTLLPMAKAALDCAGLSVKEMDLLAVSAGPGSFTGVRIGVACIKGLAFPDNKSCCGVSTLEAMAMNLRGQQALVCAVMDARCGQVYNGLFLTGEPGAAADRGPRTVYGRACGRTSDMDEGAGNSPDIGGRRSQFVL